MDNITVRPSDLNCLTIDKASFSINGSPFSEEKPVIRMVDELYAAVNHAEGDLNAAIDYRFVCGGDLNESDIRLAAEDENCLRIEVNGCTIKTARENWWIDKCIGEYTIAGFLRPGVNHVILYYRIPKMKKVLDINKVFETERNRFSYPVEPENIYIRGRFDLKADGTVSDCVDHYSISGAAFSLQPYTSKKQGDLTKQNMWFYRGDAEYEFSVDKPEDGSRVAVAIRRHHGSLIQIIVNGQSDYLFCPPFELDITDWLNPGSNSVIIRLVGTNRNLLGPHHHINGENYFVGLSIFKGQRGFEDFVTPEIRDENTWTDNYSFIPFGIEETVLRYYSEITE